MKAENLQRISIEEVKKLLLEEGQKESHQFQEWWDIFEILSYCRKLNLSEMESHSILSNRFNLEIKTE